MVYERRHIDLIIHFYTIESGQETKCNLKFFRTLRGRFSRFYEFSADRHIEMVNDCVAVDFENGQYLQCRVVGRKMNTTIESAIADEIVV